MPKKSKKSSLAWRITKATARGIGKGVVATARYISKKSKESNQRKKIQKNPAYTIPSQHQPFVSVDVLAGDFLSAQQRFHEQSNITLIFGKRGSGKSALGFRLLENIHATTKRKCFALGFDPSLLPAYIHTTNEIHQVPKGAAILVDEGAIAFSSRSSMSSQNKEISNIMAVARHNDLSLIFITQNTGMLDKNILKLTDTLLIKEGSLLQLEMERPEMKKFYEKAKGAFENLEGDKRQYAYVVDADFEGVISHRLPSFWSDIVSKNQSSNK